MPSVDSSRNPILAACAPVACPVCGGLECLCRPRFFAGQLLTDEDLKRLDHYIVEKNKLHNRFLIGWGVACGLEVVCSGCDGTVTVRPGYALSPCGEDIIVCSETPVDVCSMIQKCRKKLPPECQPAQPAGTPDPCGEGTETWVLSICYDEKTSRGIVPLKNTGAAVCCSKCACGGSCSCGCGCGGRSGGCSCGGHSSGNGNGNGGGNGNHGCCCASKTKSPTAQAQCEPTILCEGYRFEVCKLKTTDKKPTPLGAIVQRFLCCVLKLEELFAQFPSSQNPQDVKSWCCGIRDALLEFTAENPGYDCTLAQRIATMCNADDPQQIANDVGQLVVEYFQYCFCSALLPPCPGPAESDCVPLATITVGRKNGRCTIQRVCNIDARKFLVDMPNLGYWLSWIPFGTGLRQLFSRLCCRPSQWEKTPVRPVDRERVFRTAAAFHREAAKPPDLAADFMSLIIGTARKENRKVDLQTLTMAALGVHDEKNIHTLTDLELQYPFETLMLHEVGVPLVQSYLRTNLGGIGHAFRPTAEAAPPSEPAGRPTEPSTREEIDSLKTELREMQERLKRTQEELDKLSKRRKPR